MCRCCDSALEGALSALSPVGTIDPYRAPFLAREMLPKIVYLNVDHDDSNLN